MAIMHKLPSLSSSYSSSASCQNYRNFSLNPNRISFLHYKASPFTEKHSVERYGRDQWLYSTQLSQFSSCSYPLPSESDSIMENNIALQLPELKKLLRVLKEKRGNCGNDGEKYGPGNVFLVGTGPGDPDLLTLKEIRSGSSSVNIFSLPPLHSNAVEED